MGVPEAMMTDCYQLTMMYGYWKCGKADRRAVFEVCFRRCPFGGEFAVMAGVGAVVAYVENLQFSEYDMRYLKASLPPVEEGFFDYLKSLNGKQLTVSAVREGTLVFPHEPLVRVEGPLAIAQLVETAILNLLNYPTLVASNAARYRLLAGWDKQILEFGLRRAQGPDGALSASRYSYLGGCDGTSNVKAGELYGIPIKGTQAHSFVVSFETLDCLETKELRCPVKGVHCEDFVEKVLKCRESFVWALWPNLKEACSMNEGELAAFIVYAQSFPLSLVCLVDTYDTLTSGVPNFLCVALALKQLGIDAVGVRLDSGDLAYLSLACRKMFIELSKYAEYDLSRISIVASNDINERVLMSLGLQNHAVDVFAIGTNLVTCQAQPALGMVYKLVEVEGRPCLKLSQDIRKTSIPYKKSLFRLYSKAGPPLIDYIQGEWEDPPQADTRVFCRHPFVPDKRCYVVPTVVENLLEPVWDKGAVLYHETLEKSRNRCLEQLKSFRQDTLRITNPTPYKVSMSPEFFDAFRRKWSQTAPIKTLD